MDRLLLLVTTTTYRASAFLEAAGRMGVPVVVGSDRTQALASFNPGAHLTLDFLDHEASVAAIRRAAAATPIGAIIAADDDGVVLAARAAAALGHRHNPADAVLAARNKLLMRQVLVRAGIPGPPFEGIPADADPAAAAARWRYPCVLKPLALSASRGVLRADDPRGFVRAFERIAALLGGDGGGAPEARTVLVEGYLDGPEVALEGMLEGGKLRTLALFDKPDPLVGPTFEETIYVTPSRLADADQRAIHERVTAVARALGLTDGPVHAEVRIVTGSPIPIEIAPRSIGGLCSRTLRFGNGVTLEELILMQALGRDTRALGRETAAAGVMMIPVPRAGLLRDVGGRAQALAVPGIEDLRITIPSGHPVTPLPEGSRYLGFLFARAAGPEEVEAALREAHERLHIEIEPVVAAGRHTGGSRAHGEGA